MRDLSCLSKKKYPGRLIIIGQDTSGSRIVVVYAVTGRSSSSQARFLVQEKDGIWVKPTDIKTLKTGNADLLIYPAILHGKGVAVSNGLQTLDILASLPRFRDALSALKFALREWEYEPDAPSFTPRISGCVLPDSQAALSIIRRSEDGTSSKAFFKVPLMPGIGRVISTYSGENCDPLPSFSGEPESIFIEKQSALETARDVYDALGPQQDKTDLRVAVACLYIQYTDMALFEASIINRSERS